MIRFIVSAGLYGLFLLHLSFNLERTLYFNEVIVAVGVLILLLRLLSGASRLSYLQRVIDYSILIGVLAYFAGSYVNDDATLYQKLRTTPIAYSMLGFYFGYYILAYIREQRLYKPLNYLMVAPTLIGGIMLGGRISPPVAGSFMFGTIRRRWVFYLYLLTYIIALDLYSRFVRENTDGTSTLLVMLTFILFMFFGAKKFYGLVRAIRVRYIVLFMLALVVSLKVLAAVQAEFFVSGEFTIAQNPDPNIVWRLMFWSKTVIEMDWFNWLFGVGLATPIYNEADPSSYFIIASEPLATDRPYTLGLHNSYLTFFVRFGIVGLVLVVSGILSVLKKLAYSKDTMSKETMMVTIMLLVIPSLFNVVLESPLYAGIFWAMFGMVDRETSGVNLKGKLF